MRLVLILPIAALAGCSSPAFQGVFGPVSSMPDTISAPPRRAAPPPPDTATTVEEFDTTSPADRAAAVVPNATPGARALGTTIASLGSPADPGLWLKTPLVASLTAGQAEYQGRAINLELRPSGGATGSGSQISLAAMRLIGAPLTSLPELAVLAIP